MIDQNFNDNLGSDFDIDTLDKRDDYRKHPAISNSDLKYLSSPKLFKEYKEGKIAFGEPKPYQIIGQAVEDRLDMTPEQLESKYLVLQEEISAPSSANQIAFAEDVAKHKEEDRTDELLDIIRDSHYKSKTKPGDGRALYNELKKYIDLLSDKRIQISPADDFAITSMVHNLKTTDYYQNVFSKSKVFKQVELGATEETKVQWEGISWKGKPDYIVVNEENKQVTIVDLKTTSAYLSNFGWEVRSYKYYRQLFIYRLLVERNLSMFVKGNPLDYSINTGFLVASKASGYDAAFIPLPTRILNLAVEELEEYAQIILHYIKTNWTSYYGEHVNNLILNWDKVFKNELANSTRGGMAFSAKG